MPEKKLHRREFMKISGGTILGAGLVAGGLMSGSKKAEASPMPDKWDEEFDVVVIGTGFAGTAAAIDAKKAGARTVVFEKMRLPGGNSTINGGLIACACSKLQEKYGIKDSPDLLLDDMVKAGLGLNDPELVRIVAEKSRDVIDWSEEVLGVEYRDEVVHLGGHSVPRSLKTREGSGAAFIRPALKKLKELGVPVRTGVMVSTYVVDEKGRVQGVRIREGYRFPNADSGTVKNVRAKKGVIVAAGGFGYDVRFRELQDPRLGADVTCTNHPGATADALIELLRLGATPIQLCWIQSGPWGNPKEKGVGIGALFNLRNFMHGLMVDPATGKRFVNELADRRIRAEAIFATGHTCLPIVDSEGVKSYAHYIDKALAKGVVKKFDTLKDIASEFNMPWSDFKAQVNRFNQFVQAREDKEFGKPIPKDDKPVETGPFYVGFAWPKVHHCMGGVQINKNAQVIDLKGKIIPGLYAAGEVTGGIHGACRLGSNAFLDCIVFGRVAGRHAAMA